MRSTSCASKLISEMTEAASALYVATQNFWRKKRIEQVGAPELAQFRSELDQQYKATRIRGEVIERKLEAYFSNDNPRRFWHASMDLLTVRYLHLIDLATDKLRAINAGDEHSGLTADQLKDQQLLLKTYRESVRKAAKAVLDERIIPKAG